MRRPDKLFGHRLWLTPIASYVGLGGIAYAAFLLLTGAVSVWWAIISLVCTFALLMGVTVGLHRLFCHSAFKTSKFWHVVLAYLGTLGIYGSTVQWCAMHFTHHKYSDTDKDPHYTGWRYLFWKKNKRTTFNRRVLARLYRQPLHRLLHQYYLVPVVMTVLLLALAGTEALLFCYLVPLGWLHLVGSFHQVFAHDKTGPKQQPLMELLLFTGGEWSHRHHHESPKDIRFGALDAGYHFIRLIQKRPRYS